MVDRSERFIQPEDGIILVSRPSSSGDKTAFRELAKPSPARPEELTMVRRVAMDLLLYLGHQSVREAIGKAHVVNAPSSAIQALLSTEAARLGFESEVQGLFSDHAAGNIRPDYFKRIGESGILIEVERGKTLDNNMDLLDLWKCHICPAADYLFLVVPKVRQTAKGQSRPIFDRVCSRLEPLFRPPNCVNVEAVFIFGY